MTTREEWYAQRISSGELFGMSHRDASAILARAKEEMREEIWPELKTIGNQIQVLGDHVRALIEKAPDWPHVSINAPEYPGDVPPAPPPPPAPEEKEEPTCLTCGNPVDTRKMYVGSGVEGFRHHYDCYYPPEKKTEPEPAPEEHPVVILKKHNGGCWLDVGSTGAHFDIPPEELAANLQGVNHAYNERDKDQDDPLCKPESEEETVCVNLIPSRFNSGELYLRIVKHGQALRPECLLECRAVPDSGNIIRLQPVAVRENRELRKEVEGLKQARAEGREEFEAELERVKSDRDALARSYGELEKLSGAKFSEYDELREEYDKLLMLASRVRTAFAAEGSLGTIDAVLQLGALVAESDPKEGH